MSIVYMPVHERGAHTHLLATLEMARPTLQHSECCSNLGLTVFVFTYSFCSLLSSDQVCFCSALLAFCPGAGSTLGATRMWRHMDGGQSSSLVAALPRTMHSVLDTMPLCCAQGSDDVLRAGLPEKVHGCGW